jgi:hypothetical protein
MPKGSGLINANTQEVGKRIMQLILKEPDVFTVGPTMEACALIAASLCSTEAQLEGFSAVEAYAQLCEHAFKQSAQNVINIADYRKLKE